jgi:hypothetical protein
LLLIESNGTAVVAVTGSTDFTNSGLIEKEASIGTSVIDAVYTGTGTVLVQSGTLDFTDGGSASASAFTVAAGTTLELAGGIYTRSGGIYTRSGGTYGAAGKTLIAAGDLLVDGSIASGTVMTLAVEHWN